MVEALGSAKRVVRTSRWNHVLTARIKGPPGGPVTLIVSALGKVPQDRFRSDEEAIASIIADVRMD